MEQIVVKTEVQPNGEILLYYVDENAVDSNGDQVFQLEEGTDYEIMETTVQPENPVSEPQEAGNEQWSDDDIQKLLIFFLDNKVSFSSGLTRKEHLWTVACKTMLIGKNVKACESKLRSLKNKYVQQHLELQKGYNVTWLFYDLCHQAFQDDRYVETLLKDYEQQQQTVTKIMLPQTTLGTDSKIIVVKNDTSNKTPSDDKVETMLNLYLRYMKNGQSNMSSKSIWASIAMELGEEGPDYWSKRFMNFKQHYLRMLAKKAVNGPASINWPYMDLFDQIYSDDPVFQSKYADVTVDESSITVEVPSYGDDYWNDTELLILVKYYFDCFHEFQDTTIPTDFLWTEVGRLLDKKPELCKKKYEELKDAHYDQYFTGAYTLQRRIPLEIIFDNIISKEVEIEMSQHKRSSGKWSSEELDELVKFFHENLELFKDPVCYFVCWGCISRSLNRSISSCKTQWEELKSMYKSILNNKMENPDLQIDWPYMDLFDRIFDYGMNTKLLDDFEKTKEIQVKNSQKIGVKKVNIKLEEESFENDTDDEDIDEKGFMNSNKRGFGDSKAFKILVYYQKFKHQFATTQKKKQALWDVLAKKLGVTGEQCAHRFRNLKQVYREYVLREINKPDKPIIWPYYALCKRVFGYRALKSKLKNNKGDFAETEEWTPKEIKQLIGYFGHHFNELSNNDDVSKWSELAQDLGKTERAVKDRFIELRKSYRRLKTVKENNPKYKVNWKYFSMFNDIYEGSKGGDSESMDVEEPTNYEALSDERNDDEEEDYQCIIVIPEGDDINEAQFIIRNKGDTQIEEQSEAIETKPVPTKWTKKSKRRLLIVYHNYLKARKGQDISPKEMWTEIASKLPLKTPLQCRKMYAKLKTNHLKSKSLDDSNKKKTPHYTLLEKILNLKPKFPKKPKKKLSEGKPYKDVLLPANKVELALQYYLQHIDEFASPKFEKKYLWTELAKFVSEPVNKLFNKINYLKQNYSVETDEVAGEKTLFSELLREILSKENAVRAEITETPTLDEIQEASWTNDELEQLLVWYLANLDKFKNPKFVRKYLWLEASSILEKSPLTCSKKMTEIRTQYKTMIKENPNDLNQWRFYELCQKIYGTGRRNELPTITHAIDEPAI